MFSLQGFDSAAGPKPSLTSHLHSCGEMKDMCHVLCHNQVMPAMIVGNKINTQ